MKRSCSALFLLLFAVAALASPPAAPVDQVPAEAVLPPRLPWKGQSRSLVLAADQPWVAPAETSGFRFSPSYADTVSWLRRLVDASPQLKMVSLGRSPQGRDIWMVIASKDGASTPEALRASGKPTLFAQAGIHSGEIDGKDAGMMLLRDMTVRGTKADILDAANLLFVPIFNVDGHERSTPYGRINQRGPEIMGWRTNAANLNLNRDYAKIDTPEMKAMIEALDRWSPELYVDIHVTDGEDYQYDVTWGFNGPNTWSPAIARWFSSEFRPGVDQALERSGHVPGPLVFAIDRGDLSRGIVNWAAGPRFSNGYGDVRHLPTVLVENHSLKPYEQRVLGTYVFLESALRTLGKNASGLKEAIAADQNRHPKDLPLDWKAQDPPFPTIDFRGVESTAILSPVTGSVVVQYQGKPMTVTIPHIPINKPAVSARRPTAYWIPPSWNDVIDRLRTHGVRMESLDDPRTVTVEMLRFHEVKFEDSAFEGHVRTSAETAPEVMEEVFPAGTVRVPTDQPLGDLAMILLEPASPDSFFQWGFFDAVLARTEYVEDYVMEPMARRMMEQDPALKEAFERKLQDDPAFRGSPEARLQWFYEKTPWYDQRWNLYPVGREIR